MSDRQRVDSALVEQGFFSGRDKARAAVMAGLVYIGDRKAVKASDMVKPVDVLTVKAPAYDYVSRGALKLEKAVKEFELDLNGRVVVDVGASTGGFTDVCLRNGAEKVYAVDVGYGQLDWKLRNDPRVCVMERVNARYITADMFDPLPSIAVMDVSFISVKLIIPALIQIIGNDGRIISLIEPQFEAGRGKVGKKGVVREAEIHEEVLHSTVEFCESVGWRVNRLEYSPVTGPEGNIEFLAEIIRADESSACPDANEIRDLVDRAHTQLVTAG